MTPFVLAIAVAVRSSKQWDQMQFFLLFKHSLQCSKSRSSRSMFCKILRRTFDGRARWVGDEEEEGEEKEGTTRMHCSIGWDIRMNTCLLEAPCRRRRRRLACGRRHFLPMPLLRPSLPRVFMQSKKAEIPKFELRRAIGFAAKTPTKRQAGSLNGAATARVTDSTACRQGEDVNFLEQPSNHRRRYHLRPSVRPSVSQSLVTHSLMPSLPP